MKSPDDIKKGLECCSSIANCADGCPYHVIVEGSFGCEEMGCEDGLLPDALALIQQLEAQVPGWINVEERLPDKLKRVLVFKQRNEHALWHVAMWDIEIDWRGESDWSKNPDNGWFSVTHWMPLPEPPKEE